jgi:hypothetical protein
MLTNKDHVTSDSTVHYQALKGNAFRLVHPSGIVDSRDIFLVSA